MKKVAILQSNYIPWKGYFDLINLVDEFIIYDEMQYTKNDWRNRNKIKSKTGLEWLTIPVRQEHLHQKIQDTKIVNKQWNKKHWNTIQTNYAKARFYSEYKSIFEELYLNCTYQYLSEINYHFIKAITFLLGIQTKISMSTDYTLIEGKTERLVDLCQQANATEYISGPSAKDYINASLFEQQNIRLSWMDYSNYLEYNQLFPPFEHGVSIIDLILNEGSDSKKYMKSFINGENG